MRIKLAVALIVLGSVTVLPACSDQSRTPTAADTAFAQDMSMHASSAMDLADQARTRSKDPQVQALADEVFTAVAPIVDMLTELGPALAADGAEGFAHEDSADHDTKSSERSDALRAAPAKAFDRTFRTSLVRELTEGLEIAQRARESVADSRSKSIADTATTTWSSLLDSNQLRS